jgi:hypothetical protein
VNFVRAVVSEVLGLFIDDGSLALLSLGLVALVTVLIKLLGLPPIIGGLLLLLGCLAILAESTLRAGRSRR